MKQHVISTQTLIGETLSADNTGTTESSRIVTRVEQLKEAIDSMDRGAKTAKKLIQELAAEIEKEGSPKGVISRKIKELLQDKIREGKITAKWIEDCLPKEYKRPYKKSEVTSLLSKAKDNHGLTGTTDGISNHQIDNRDFAKKPGDNTLSSKVDENPTTERLAEDVAQIVIHKDSLAKIVKALEKCSELCYVTVSTIGHLIDIQSDTAEKGA